MNQDRNDGPRNKPPLACLTAKSKRIYAKPAFKHEKVFETMALACGKLSATQAQCHFNRKLS